MSTQIAPGTAPSDNQATVGDPGQPTTRRIQSSSTARVALARAKQILVADAAALFGGPSDDARRHQRHSTLRVNLGAGASLHQEVLVQSGPVRATEAGVALPVRWEPTGRNRFLPSFEGELELTDVREGTSLRLSGAYTVPLGRIGKIGNRLFGARVAQRSLDAFVANLGRRIDAAVQRRLATSTAPIAGSPDPVGAERPEIYIG